MTLQETAQIMDILTIAYPQFYNGKNAPDPQKALILWSSMFADDDAAVVAAAIKALIVSDPGNFPPSIGTVKAKVRQITAPQDRRRSLGDRCKGRSQAGLERPGKGISVAPERHPEMCQ